jgi:hypothetical protein
MGIAVFFYLREGPADAPWLNKDQKSQIEKDLARRWHAAGPLMIAALGWCVMPFLAHDPWASIVVMTLVAAATFSFTGPFWSMPIAMLSGAAAASASSPPCWGLGRLPVRCWWAG